MSESGLVARRQAELRLRVGEHLDDGETLDAALWIARSPGLPLIAKVTRAPADLPGFGGSMLAANPQSGLHGPAGSIAADLDSHLPEHTIAAALALTGTRVLLLRISEAPSPALPEPSGLMDRVRRMFERAEPEPLPPLTPVWRRPRSVLAATGTGDRGSELALRFTDGSSLTVDAPLAHLL
ncbi:hypothetical protein Acy02nite_35430 [Actinoplanes cyaneus]|uniref:Uncharacterized protein n=1 Tax=Actinoplanes cyaneus TaxID=52696 RepID=A0A919M4I9_9ACTN|nr:hypothetical protein [Actinoplanes cyaneus]MCW2140344.1 hypothetical protein [Actinoplanes cyaneus]GID65662.1 hypothetical protein Acy02nite_35430 [Actinoplanes cyaneus]